MEQTRFLVRELQALLEADGLLDTDDVVVVAARVAYGEYQNHAVYVCQPGRAFRRGLTHLGFYTDGAIQPVVPRIVAVADNVPFTAEEAASPESTRSRMVTPTTGSSGFGVVSVRGRTKVSTPLVSPSVGE